MARPTSPLGNRWRRAAGVWLTCGNKCDSLRSTAINTTFILSASKVCFFMPNPFKSDEWARTFADHTLFLASNLVDLMTVLRCEGEAEMKPSACFFVRERACLQVFTDVPGPRVAADGLLGSVVFLESRCGGRPERAGLRQTSLSSWR